MVSGRAESVPLSFGQIKHDVLLCGKGIEPASEGQMNTTSELVVS